MPIRYIHIPKCAGTTFLRIVGKQDTIDWEDKKPLPPHYPGWGFPSIRTFALVRCPWDRAISLCAHVYRGTQIEVTPDLFAKWVLDGMPTLIKQGESIVTNCGYVVDSLRLGILSPQTMYLKQSSSGYSLLSTKTYCLDKCSGILDALEYAWEGGLFEDPTSEKPVNMKTVFSNTANVSPIRKNRHVPDFYKNRTVKESVYARFYQDFIFFGDRGYDAYSTLLQ